MDLYLRKSDQGQLGPEIYRVILKDDGDKVEIGSIGVQHSAGAQYYWKWAIDTVIPMLAHQNARPRHRPRRLHAKVQRGVD
jgi:hypothetical protein